MSVRIATYLDSNAGAPLRREVSEALLAFLQSPRTFSNPSSIHSHGRKARKLLAEARESIARSLGPGCFPENLIFTSSGTEANQLAVRSVFEPLLLKGARPHWILTAGEHDSNLQMVEWLKARGGEVDLLPLLERGIPDVSGLPGLLRPNTALVSVLWVNNETGVVSDLPPVIEAARARGVAVHLDAAQAWGKLPVDCRACGADFLTLSAHKIGGLPGTGALWAKPGRQPGGLILGKQEIGRRGGTENLLGIVAMGIAARLLDPAGWAGRVEPLRNRLESAIRQRIPGVVVHGEGAPRVANTSNLGFEGVEGESLVMALDLAGYSVSAGSACSSGTVGPSHVLMAMGRTPAQAMAAIRVSFSDEVSSEVIDGFVDALESLIARMRRIK